jgi:hypothetical protein
MHFDPTKKKPYIPPYATKLSPEETKRFLDSHGDWNEQQTLEPLRPEQQEQENDD